MKKLRTYLIYLQIFLIISVASFGQTEENDKIKSHSPKKAMLLSAVLPGAGQAYNRKFWKIPIVYVGIGGFSYLAYNNQKQFNKYRDAYITRNNGGIDEFYNILNSQALINEMEKYRKQRDLNLIGFFAFYMIQMVDASVDAHLFEFDVSDKLSLRVQPITGPNYATVGGISLKYKF